MLNPIQPSDISTDEEVMRTGNEHAHERPVRRNRTIEGLAGNGLSRPDDALRATKPDQSSRARDQHISLAAEAANMGFWFRDFDRDEFWACDQWRALLGFTNSEILTVDKLLQRFHPDDREPTRQALEKAFQGDGRYHTEHRVVLPDGQIRWLACQGRLELNEDDQPRRLMGVSLDITGRKLAELEAQVHRNEAAHLLRVASLGELSSALAHELKQPLTAILSNAHAAELLLARDPCDLQEVRDILKDIVADDTRAGEVIDRLHGLVKRREFQPQPLEVDPLILDVLHLMTQDLMSRSIRVVTEFNASTLSIRGDRVQLQQVLINLIQNAADSMMQSPPRDRTLAIGSARLAGNVIGISVSDTGQGIPPGDEERIFESYYTTKPGGLGLGLSLSRSILRAHGGQLRAETHNPSGATFRCTLPEWRDGCASGESQDTLNASIRTAGPNTVRHHSHITCDFPAAATPK